MRRKQKPESTLTVRINSEDQLLIIRDVAEYVDKSASLTATLLYCTTKYKDLDIDKKRLQKECNALKETITYQKSIIKKYLLSLDELHNIVDDGRAKG